MTTKAGRGAESPETSGHPWHALVAVVCGVMMVTLDGSIVSVANPAISASLQPSFGELQWVTHAYLLGLTVSLIVAGKLGDRWGHRRVYFVGVGGFVLTSMAIGLSPNVGIMIALRIVQGVFGAALIPCALGLIRAQFPEHLLNRALGAFSAVIGASTAAGPVVGGLLVSVFDWNSVFFVNVPVGLVALVLGRRLLAPNRPVDRDSRTDLPGAGLLAVATFGLVLGVVTAQESGWTAPGALAPLLIGIAVGAIFVRWQQRARHPLVPMPLFRSPSVSIGVALVALFALAMFGSIFFLTFFLQNVQAASAMRAGIQLMPLSVLLAVVPSVGGRLIDRHGIRAPVMAGLGLAAAGMVALSALEPASGPVLLTVGLAVLGTGLGVVNIGATAAIVGGTPVRYAGVAGGLQSSALHLGSTLGPAVLGSVVAAYVNGRLPDALSASGAAELGLDQQMRSAVAQGTAAPPDGFSPEVADAITRSSHQVFVDGVSTALLVAAGVTVVAAGISAFLPGKNRGPAGGGAGSGDDSAGDPEPGDQQPGDQNLSTENSADHQLPADRPAGRQNSERPGTGANQLAHP